jgi:hypothetical protein
LKKIQNRVWLLAPLFGTLIYFSLYIVASFSYPGGSEFDPHSKGFSWTQNYWCNLLNETSNNGQHNPARPVALIAMAILCLTLVSFWFIFSKRTGLNKQGRLTIQVSGFISMLTGIFLFTRFHDIIINIASLFGLIATIGTLIGLYRLKWRGLFRFGIFNLMLVLLNNILYYNEGLRIYLPSLQKFSFSLFLLWICLIDLRIFRIPVAPGIIR